MPLVEGVQYGPSGGASSKIVPFEMTPYGGMVVAVVGLEHQQVIGLAIHDALRDVFLAAHRIKRHPE